MISIIGAGPAGSYLAHLLAKNNYEVSVFEEHSKIGHPMQCTGIITSALNDIMQIKKEFLLNKVNLLKVFSPSGHNLTFKTKRPNLIIDRTKFDQHIANKAMDQGAKIHLNHKYITNKGKEVHFKNKKINTDILVGADGPFSKVARENNLFNNRKFIQGIQVRAKIVVDPEIVEIWLGYGLFGWVVPESNKIAKIGIVSKNNSIEAFNSFFSKRAKNSKIISHNSGAIPIYNKNIQAQKDFVYLLGDAATMVKATSLGGVVQGFLASNCLCESLTKNLDYEKLWRKKIGKDLLYSLWIHKIFSNFTIKDHNLLIKNLAKEKTKKLLEKFDRDFVSEFLFKVLVSQPRLLFFLTKLL